MVGFLPLDWATHHFKTNFSQPQVTAAFSFYSESPPLSQRKQQKQPHHVTWAPSIVETSKRHRPREKLAPSKPILKVREDMPKNGHWNGDEEDVKPDVQQEEQQRPSPSHIQVLQANRSPAKATTASILHKRSREAAFALY